MCLRDFFSGIRMKREEIIELVNKINSNPKRLKIGLYPLEYTDDGFRIVFSVYLKKFTFLPEGKLLWEEAILDQDFKGLYYWIPYGEIPKAFTTPAIKLSTLHDEDKKE